MKTVSFGSCLFCDFPFSEGNSSKKRLAMVLADLGDRLIVAYITSNHELQGIDLGYLESRTSLLAPNRYAVISKSDVYWSASERQGRGCIRIDLAFHKEAAAIVRAIILIARNGGYSDFGPAILAGLEQAVRLADSIRQQKERACPTTTSRSTQQRTLPPKTANSLRLSVR